MQIHNYDDLLQAARQQPEPQRLLFVFARAVLPKDASAEERRRFEAGEGGALQPLMCVDKRPEELGRFEDLVNEAAEMDPNWQFVFVASLAGRAGLAPTPEEGEQPLKRMISSIQNGGDLSPYLALDRNGRPVAIGR